MSFLYVDILCRKILGVGTLNKLYTHGITMADAILHHTTPPFTCTWSSVITDLGLPDDVALIILEKLKAHKAYSASE